MHWHISHTHTHTHREKKCNTNSSAYFCQIIFTTQIQPSSMLHKCAFTNIMQYNPPPPPLPTRPCITMIMTMKGAIQDVLQSVHCPALPTASNTHAQVARVQLYGKSYTTHGALSRPAHCVPSGMKGQLSHEVWQSRNCIYFSIIYWLKPSTDDRGEETRGALPSPLNASECKGVT